MELPLRLLSDSIWLLYTVLGTLLKILDNLSGSIDDLPASLDSAFYRGGEFFFAASKDKKIQSFTGATLPATLETGEFEIQSGFSSNIRNIIPYITVQQSQSAVVTAQVASRNRQSRYLRVRRGGSPHQYADNYIPVRSTGKIS